MLEKTETLLPSRFSEKKLCVICIGQEKDSLKELDRLLGTLNIASVKTIILSKNFRIRPATYIGKGKLEEAKNALKEENAGAVIINKELAPNQLRNIEKELKCPILDRPGVIIEIFSSHAKTKEAKTQVELARLQYLLPRLAHFWTHFERQRGGIGLKGVGEKQIEIDRRLVKNRISILRKRLETISDERSLRRGGRNSVLKVAFVGYTNAGKSTLLNAITQSNVLVEDKLFATLDSSVRMLDPHSHPPLVAIDTVGFIRNLPPTLIASFRSTLEELSDADLLIHVVDASSHQIKDELETTNEILKELDLLEKPRITIFNKMDLVENHNLGFIKIHAGGELKISALNQSDIKLVRKKIFDHFKNKLEIWELVLPYAETKLQSQLSNLGQIETERFLKKGTFYRVRIDKTWAKRLNLSRFKT